MPLRCVLPQSGTRCRTHALKYWNQQLPFRTATPRAAPGFTPLRAARRAFPRGAATLCFIKLFLAATPRLGSTDRRTGMRQASGLRGRATIPICQGVERERDTAGHADSEEIARRAGVLCAPPIWFGDS